MRRARGRGQRTPTACPGDLGHAALVDIPDHATRVLALDEDLDRLIVLEDGHSRLVARRGDDHLLVHSRDSSEPAASVGRHTPPETGARAKPHAQQHQPRQGARQSRTRSCSAQILGSPTSIGKPPHSHVENEAKSGHRRDERRPAIAHERQRQPLHRGQPRRHGDVVQHLERESRNDCDHQERADAILGQLGRRRRCAR